MLPLFSFSTWILISFLCSYFSVLLNLILFPEVSPQYRDLFDLEESFCVLVLRVHRVQTASAPRDRCLQIGSYRDSRLVSGSLGLAFRAFQWVLYGSCGFPLMLSPLVSILGFVGIQNHLIFLCTFLVGF